MKKVLDLETSGRRSWYDNDVSKWRMDGQPAWLSNNHLQVGADSQWKPAPTFLLLQPLGQLKPPQTGRNTQIRRHERRRPYAFVYQPRHCERRRPYVYDLCRVSAEVVAIQKSDSLWADTPFVYSFCESLIWVLTFSQVSCPTQNHSASKTQDDGVGRTMM